jgi:hypothetical protein
LGLLLASCSSGSPSRATTVPYDEDFALGVGQTAAVSDTDLVVRLVQVADDSRCPEDVQCVTAGDATVRLAVRAGRGTEQALELRTFGEAAEARFEAYRIRLQLLAPRPRDGQPVPPAAYVATLRVRRS